MVNLVKSEVNGVITAPGSKSYLQRALVAALLTRGETTIENVNYCDDVVACISAVKALGAKVHHYENGLKIQGGLEKKPAEIHVGESGLSLRLFSAVSSLVGKKILITGEGTLLSRPTSIISETLSPFGIKVKATKGKLPVEICGPPRGDTVIADGSVSSQVLSGLLMTLPLAVEDSELIVMDLKSAPYIDMTIDMLSSFGIEIETLDYSTFYIPGKQQYKPISYFAEGDWSGAAFLLVAGAIAGNVRVEGLNAESIQADKAILDILSSAGVNLTVSTQFVETVKSEIRPFVFDATHCPDLFPPAVVLASNASGRSTIKGVSRLIHKESNRSEALRNEFGALGINITIENDDMHIEGGPLKAASCSSHNDHRIAMAVATASLVASGSVSIDNIDCVAKSYPKFFDDLAKLKV